MEYVEIGDKIYGNIDGNFYEIGLDGEMQDLLASASELARKAYTLIDNAEVNIRYGNHVKQYASDLRYSLGIIAECVKRLEKLDSIDCRIKR